MTVDGMVFPPNLDYITLGSITESAEIPVFAHLCAQSLEDEIEQFRQLFSDVRSRLPISVTGSVFAEDRELCRDNGVKQVSFVFTADYVEMLIGVMQEHIEVLRFILNHNKLHLPPALTSVRAIFEAMMISCWYMDTTVDHETRVARFGATLLESATSSVKLARKFVTKSADVPGKIERLREVRKLYSTDGFKLNFQISRNKGKPNKDVVESLSFKSATVNLRPNYSQLNERYCPDDPWTYSLLSNFAHSTRMMLGGGETAEEALMTILIPLFDGADAYTQALGNYFGFNVEPFLTQRAERLGFLLAYRHAFAEAGEVD